MKTIFKNIGCLLTLQGVLEKRGRKVTESDLGLVQNAALVVDKKKIDLIVVATSTPDKFFPSTACLIQEQLGLKADDLIAELCPAGETQLLSTMNRPRQVVVHPKLREAVSRIDLGAVTRQPRHLQRTDVCPRPIVQPRQVLADDPVQLRLDRIAVRQIRRRIAHVSQRPSEAAHLIRGEDTSAGSGGGITSRAAGIISGRVPRPRTEHSVIRPERHLVRVEPIAGEQVRNKN